MSTEIILPYNDAALHRDETYAPIDVVNLGDRVIVKYLLNVPDFAGISRAVEVIQVLLRDNPDFFCTTFLMETLRDEITRKPYLTINGRALSISEDFAEENEAYRDCFTEASVIHPIVCDEGHIMERDRAQLWIERNGQKNICPFGNHRISSLQLDPRRERDATLHRNVTIQASAERDTLMLQQRLASLQTRIIEVVSRLMSERKTVATRSIAGGVLKIGIKGGAIAAQFVGKEIIKTATEIAAKEIAKAAGKEISKSIAEDIGKKAAEEAGKKFEKLIPGIGVPIGIGLACHRFYHRQYVRGVGEIISGVTPLIPVWGQGISLGVDAVLLTADISETFLSPSLQDASDHPTGQIVPFDLAGAYKILGIRPADSAQDRTEVDDAYRWFYSLTHVEEFGMGNISEEWRLIMDVGAAAIENARQTIYQEKSWA